MTLTFHILWMLCGLGTAVFATFVGGFVAWIALALGFALSRVWLDAGHPIDAAWVGGLVAVVAATRLVRSPHRAVMAFASGALAAAWASLLQVQGLNPSVAMVSGAALPLTSAYLSQRIPAFAPPLLQEEALVALLALGVAVAVVPAVSQGWQSALALNLTGTSASMPLVPTWLVCFVGASTALGGLWSLWRRG